MPTGSREVRRLVARDVPAAAMIALFCLALPPVHAAVTVIPLGDTVLDADALLFATTAPYGRAINGQSFQTEALMTFGGHQYATWYHLGTSDEDVYLARRALPHGAWEIMDTGVDLTRTTSDAHNVISMGISGNGVIHLSWDHHGHPLKYMNTAPGAAVGAAWNASIFNGERSSLNPGGTSLIGITYPRFITHPNTGDMIMSFRLGGSGNGDVWIATYNAVTGLWNSPHEIIDGRNGDVYTDPLGSSNSRNAYLNGMDVDATGRIQMTWTWRESAGGANHDILYAYSDNGGVHWSNNAGTNLGSQISIASSTIYIDDANPGNGILGKMDRRNTIMNQQAQAVDSDNRVHVVMWHADDAHRNAVSGFDTGVSDYFHYWRDPLTGAWTRTGLPTNRQVGSRPDIAYDPSGNLYVVYVTPGPGDSGGYYTDGDLVIASSTKAAAYTDWSIVYTDPRDFSGEPFIDQNRLLNDGILSIFIQEHDDLDPGITGTPLHILDFGVSAVLTWAGDDLGLWDNHSGTDWDTDGDNAGDVAFDAGDVVWFDDNAATFTVPIAGPVAPRSTRFNNTLHAYLLTGAGIGGAGTLCVAGGGTVTLANGANSYTGDTLIDNGTLALSGAATIAGSANINVSADGTLEVSAVSGGPYTLDGQTLTIDGSVVGDIVATGQAIVHVNSAQSMNGNLSVQYGAQVNGVGRITGNLVAQTGGVVQVAPDAATSLVVMYEENFGGDGTSPLNGQAPDTVSGGATWVAHSGVPDDGINISIAAGSSATLPFAVADGFVYTLEASLRNVAGDGDWFAIGFLEGLMNGGISNGNRFISDPTTGKAWMLFRGDNSGEANQFFLGDASNGTAFGGPWPTLNINGGNIDMRVMLDTTGGPGNYTAEFLAKLPTSDAYTSVAGPRSLISENIGAVGFAVSHSDVVGDMISFRLRSQDPAATLRVLSVGGDATLGAGATLELGIFSPTDSDQLSVGGNASVGGTLHVAFDTGAPPPQPGDSFNIIEAASINGTFETIALDGLQPGHVWDLRALYTAGVISVLDAGAVLDNCLACLTGPGGGVLGGCPLQDQDGDEDVDLYDYATVERCVSNASGLLLPGCLAE